MFVFAVDKPELAPFEMPARFKTDVAYFMTPQGEHGVPDLPARHYWIRLDDARRWLEELVVDVPSPLDSTKVAELELSEEQEAWLEWMVEHRVEQVRLESGG